MTIADVSLVAGYLLTEKELLELLPVDVKARFDPDEHSSVVDCLVDTPWFRYVHVVSHDQLSSTEQEYVVGQIIVVWEAQSKGLALPLDLCRVIKTVEAGADLSDVWKVYHPKDRPWQLYFMQNDCACCS